MGAPLIGVDMDHFIAHVYDPAKAREYYLRTRELTGRTKGSAADSGGKSVGSGVAPSPAKPPTKPTVKGDRAAILKGRLGRLEEILDDLTARVEAAKARSGIATPTKKPAEADKSKDPSTPSKEKSSSQKKKDAKAAADRYEKNKTAETSKGAQAVQDEIEDVQKAIAEARAELADALAKAKQKNASSKPKAAAVGRPTQQQKGDRQNGA